MTMRPIPNLPWHEVARRLREQGKTINEICDTVFREPQTVRRLLVPGVREKQAARWGRYWKARWARDPKLREAKKRRRKAYYAANPDADAKRREQERLYKARTREKRNAQRRERYALDAEYRAQEVARKRARRVTESTALACDQARWPRLVSASANSSRGISHHA